MTTKTKTEQAILVWPTFQVEHEIVSTYAFTIPPQVRVVVESMPDSYGQTEQVVLTSATLRIDNEGGFTASASGRVIDPKTGEVRDDWERSVVWAKALAACPDLADMVAQRVHLPAGAVAGRQAFPDGAPTVHRGQARARV